MSRKVTIPNPISALIRQMGLSRWLAIELLNYLHIEAAEDYTTFRRYRAEGDAGDTQCRHRRMIEENGAKHLFTFTFDDATSPDHLIVTNIRHDVR